MQYKKLKRKERIFSLLKEKWKGHSVIVFFVGTSMALIWLAGLLEAVQKIAAIFKKLLG